MDKMQYEIYHEKIDHTPPDFPYNIYLCSIPLDFTSVKIHWHDEAEIIVIKKGEGHVSVDLTQYSVSAGDIVIVLPGQLHSIEQKNSSAMEYENIIFKPAMLRSPGHDSCGDSFIAPLFSGEISIPRVIRPDSDFHSDAAEAIYRIDRLSEKRPYGFQLALKGCLFQLMFLLVSNSTAGEEKTVGIKSLEKVKFILTYIAENYQRSISIEEISGECYYSKSYFMKFFKANMGMGFVQYLNDYRLEAAAELLSRSDRNILDIAINTGFDNLSYFNRCFKKKFGVTPGKYRSRGM